jgi:voltage-gated potassium channel
MSNSWRRILVGGVFFGLTCLVATGGYMLAGWQLLDAIYMVVITVFGVGFGEVQPLDNPSLKVFTMCVIVAGCSSGIYVVGGFVQMLAEGEINRVLGTRRMSKGIEKLENHALICGYGRVGQMLAADLAAGGHAFVVLDTNEGRTMQAQAAGFLTILGNASEEPTLIAAGIARAKVLATVLPDDSANVFITLTARDLNPTIEIIARAESPSTEKKLIRSGATRIVMPALIGATKIAHMILRPSAEDMLSEATGNSYLNEELKQIGLELIEIDLHSGSPLLGRTVGDMESGGSSGFVVVAIKRPEGDIMRAPKADVVLGLGDRFVIMGHRESLSQLSLRAKPRAKISHRGITN